MHTKVIKGKEYYYTTIRETSEKTRTIYLGSDLKTAKIKEKELHGVNKSFFSTRAPVYLLLLVFCGLTLLISGQITGLYTYSQDTVEFEWNETWNLSESFVRISLGDYVQDVDTSELLIGELVTVDMNSYSFNETGIVYIDLIVGQELVNTQSVEITEDIEIIEEPVNETLITEIPEEPLVNETTEETFNETIIENTEELTDEIMEEPVNEPFSQLDEFGTQEEFTIQSGDPPTIDSLILNATSPYNLTTDNLTAYVEVSDVDNDPVSLIYDWRKDGDPVTLLNMPFDSNNSAGTGKTKDYSTKSNNGTVNGARWNATGGWNGTGAYNFVSTSTSYVESANNLGISGANPRTITFWAKLSNTNAGTLVSTGTASTNQLFAPVVYTNQWYLNGYGGGNDWATSVVPDTNLHFHAISYNGTHAEWYLDGNRIGTGFNHVFATVDNKVRIGLRIDNSLPCDAMIDSVQIWNRSLSHEQILALYNNRSDLIVSQETNSVENWTVVVTPNDGTSDGDSKESSILIASNYPPVISSLILNATSSDNYTTDNLTAYVMSLDVDGDDVSLIYDWRNNASGIMQSIAVLNIPFDSNNSGGTGKTKDYSTTSNNGTVNGATWVSNGWNGTGAYNFNPGNNITIPYTDNLNLTNFFTLMAYIQLGSKVNTNEEGKTNYGSSPRDGPWTYYSTYNNLSTLNDSDENTGVIVSAPTPNPFHLLVTFPETRAITKVTVNAGQYNGNQNAPSSMVLYEGNQITTSLANLNIGYANTNTTINGAVGSNFYVIKIGYSSYASIQEITFYYGELSYGGTIIEKQASYSLSANEDTLSTLINNNESTTITSSFTQGLHQIASTYDGNNLSLYLDGNLVNTSYLNQIINGTSSNITIGGDFSGIIDEVKLFNRSLSSQQIFALYNNRSDLIVSQETSEGENWTVVVTPNDGTVDGTSVESNGLVIQELVAENAAPLFEPISDFTKEEDFVEFTLDLSDNISDGQDADGDLGISYSVNDTGVFTISIDNATDVVTFTAVANAFGSRTVNLTVVDTEGLTNSTVFDLTVTAVNDVPLIEPVTGFSLAEDFGYHYLNLTDNVSDVETPNASLEISYTLNETGLFTVEIDNATKNVTLWSLENTYGSRELNLTVVDGDGATNTTSFDVTITNVNDAPTFSAISSFTKTEDFAEFTLDLSDNITDNETADADLVIDYTMNDSTVFSISIDNSTDIVTFTATANQYGSVEVNLTVRDGSLSNTTTFDLIVTSVNDVPTLSSLILNSTSSNNYTTDNLTAYAIGATDVEGSVVSLIYDWRNNRTGTMQSLAVLNAPFDSNNSAGDSKTKDYSTTSNNGTVNGATWVSTGWNGTGAFDFDGINGNSVYWAYDDSLNLTEKFTVSVRVKFDSFPEAGYLGLGTSYNGGGPLDGTGWGLALGPEGALLIIGNLSGAVTDPFVATGALATDVWYQFVGTYDRTTGNMSLYVNGEFNGSTLSDGFVTNTANFIIGHFGGPNPNLDGTVDEFLVFNKTLSSEQIKAWYDNHTDWVLSQETSVGENWTVVVTPNDGSSDGVALESYGVVITAIADSVPLFEPISNFTKEEDFVEFTLDLSDNISDGEDADAYLGISYSVNDSGVFTISIDNATDVVTFTAVANAFGSRTVNLTVVDTSGVTNSTVFDLTVTAVNDNPLMESVTGFSLTEDFGYHYLNLTDNVSDVETAVASLELSYTLNDTGLFTVEIDNATKNVTLSSLENTYGSRELNLTVTDGSLTNITSFDVTITNVNDAPTFSAVSSFSKAEDFAEFTLDLSDNISDNETSDADLVIDYTINDSSVFGISINNVTNIATFIATANQFGSVEVNLTVRDGSASNTTTFDLTITSVNDLPSITSLILNATTSSNLTTDNLTAYVTGISDIDGDDISLIYDWRNNASGIMQSMTVLNMPFDHNNSAGIEQTKDYSTYSNNGTVTAATWVNTGWNDTGAYEFDGTGDYIRINSLPSPNVKNWTLSVWVKRGTVPAGTETASIILLNGNDDSNGYAIGVKTDNTVSILYPAVHWEDSTYTLSENVWTHLSAVNKDGTLYLYVNGAFYQDLGSVHNAIAPTASATIGTQLSGPGPRFFNGTIDEVKIYNITLSDDQIKLLYENRTDIISFNETSPGENWTVVVTPNDGTLDGNPVESNGLIIQALPNAAPTFEAISDFTKTEDFAEFTLDVSDNISDDNDADADLGISYTMNDSTVFSISIDNATDEVTFTAIANQYGSVEVNLTVVDTAGLTNTTTFDLIVTSVNDAPTFEAISDFTKTEDFAEFTLDVSDNISDDNDADADLGISYTMNDSTVFSISIDNSTDVVTFTSLVNQYGSVELNLTVVDTAGLTNTTTFDLIVTSVNDNPLFESISDFNLDEDFSEFLMDLSDNISDTETADAELVIDYSLNDSTKLSISINNATDLVTFTSLTDQTGYVEVNFTVWDEGGKQNSTFFILGILGYNDNPLFEPISDFTLNEDFGYHYINLSDNISDVETSDESLQISYTLNDSSLFTVEIDNSTNNLTIWSLPNTYGSAELNLTVTDGLATNITSFIVTVTNVNDNPNFDPISAFSLNEDFETYNLDVSANISDNETTDADLVIDYTINDTGLFTISIVNSTDVVTFTSVANASGSRQVNLTVVDEEGATNTTTFDLVINAVNDLPTFAPITNFALDEDFGYVMLNLTDNISDVETSDPNLEISYVLNSSGLVTVNIDNSTNNVTIYSVTDQTGSVEINLTVVDEESATNTTSFILTVNPANDNPLFEPISDFSLTEDFGTYELDVSDNISDAETADADLLIDYTINSSGLFTISVNNATDVITFTSLLNTYGSREVNLTVTDGSKTNTTSFVVTITPINDNPLFESISDITKTEDFTEFTIDLSDNISDNETSDTNLEISYTINNTGLLTLAINNATNIVTFTAVANAYGSREVNLTVTDGTLTNTTTFNFIVTPISDAPSISSIEINTTYGNNLTSENITAYILGLNDPENDTISLIYDWRVNEQSITRLNLPFDHGDSAGEDKTKDYSTFSQDGTIFNALWTSLGWNNTGAYYFDGTGTDYISIPNSNNLDFESELTLECWAKPNETNDDAVLIYRYGSVGTDDGYTLGQTADGKWFFNITVDESADSVLSDGAVSAQTWQHIVGVRENDGTLKLYVNGELQSSTGTKSGTIDGSGIVTIGETFNHPDRPFNGTIDQVKIYNVSLTAEQVRELYLNNTHLIVSQQTTAGENWTLFVTPNDGTQDGTAVGSNSLVIRNLVPGFEPITDFSKDEDFTQFTLDLSDNISDNETSDSNLLIHYIINDTGVFTLTLDNSTDELTFTSLANESGSREITLTLIDEEGATNTTSFIFTVNAVNDPLLFEPISDFTKTEDFNEFTLDLSNNLTDVETSDTNIEISYTINSTGLVTLSIDNTTNIVTFIAVSNAFGSREINLTAIDEGGYANTTSFVLTVISVNDNPLFEPISDFSKLQNFGYVYLNLSDNISDIETSNTNLEISYTINDTGIITVEIDNLTNNLTIRSVSGGYGSREINLTVIDEDAAINTTNFVFTASEIIDLIPPQIISTTISNYSIMVNDSNFINASATDDYSLSSLQVNITLPNTTVETYTLPVYYNASLVGRYDLTFIASDASGNKDTTTDYYMTSNINQSVTFKVINADEENVSIQLDVYLPGTTKQVTEYNFNGTVSDHKPSVLYDLQYLAYNNSLNVLLRNVNITIDNNNTLGLDQFATPYSNHLATYGINNTYTFGTATVTINYTSLSYTNEANLKLYKCENLNFASRTCLSTWTDVTNNAIQNTTSNTLNLNVTSFSGFSIYQYVAPSTSSTSTSTSTGGGGGGGGASTDLSRFTINKQKLEFQMVLQEAQEETITFTSKSSLPQKIKANMEGLNGLVTLSEDSFTLEPGEEKEVTIYVVSHKQPGIHYGTITFESPDHTIELPTLIEIETQTLLFDASIDLLPEFTEIESGTILPSQITVFSVGNPRKVDIDLNYIIKDSKGKTVLEEHETIAVQGQKSFQKQFFIPSDVEDGKYILGLEVGYINSLATASKSFNIKTPLLKMGTKRLIPTMSIAFITFAIMFGLLFMIFLFVRRHKRGKFHHP